MDSTGHFHFRIFYSVAAALLAATLTGCYTSPAASAAAPRSAITRDRAIALANDVATSIGGRVYVIAPSGSMLPTLDEGSIVTVENIGLDKLKRGDIVIYRNASGIAVIHRLYEKHGNRWFVLGDNNASIDHETVSAGNFLGRVCTIFYTAADAPNTSRASVSPPLTAVASIH